MQQYRLGASRVLSGFAEKDGQIPPGQHVEGESGACLRGEGSCRQPGLSQCEWGWPPAWQRLDHEIKQGDAKLGLSGFQRRLKEKLVVVFYFLMGGQRENRAWELLGGDRYWEEKQH